MYRFGKRTPIQLYSIGTSPYRRKIGTYIDTAVLDCTSSYGRRIGTYTDTAVLDCRLYTILQKKDRQAVCTQIQLYQTVHHHIEKDRYIHRYSCTRLYIHCTSKILQFLFHLSIQIKVKLLFGSLLSPHEKQISLADQTVSLSQGVDQYNIIMFRASYLLFHKMFIMQR